MRSYRMFFVTLGVLLFCSPAFAAGSPIVYVSASASSTVYKAAPPTVASAFLTDGGHQPEGMAYGPDQLIYVCEPQNGMIIRFDPSLANPIATTVFAFSETGPSKPQCGRFTSTGDLLVSDVAGTGVWEFLNMSGSANPTTINPSNILPAAKFGGTFTGAGLTQLNNGDLIVVNQANNTLYLVSYDPSAANTTHFSSTATAITLSSGSLDTPIGVARNSTNDIFVSQGGATDSIVRLHLSSGTTYTPAACATFTVVEGPNNQPNRFRFTRRK